MTSNTITAAIMRAAQEPNGADASKLSKATGLTIQQMGHVLQKLCATKDLFRAKLSHRVVRYFDTEERAAAYIRKHGPYSGETRADRAKKAAAAMPQGPVIVPENVKHVILKNYPPHRYWVDPASVPVFRYGSQS